MNLVFICGHQIDSTHLAINMWTSRFIRSIAVYQILNQQFDTRNLESTIGCVFDDKPKS